MATTESPASIPSPLGRLRARALWLRERPLLLVIAYGVIVAACCFALTRPVVLVDDGRAYMEMAWSARSGSLEVRNGLDIVDSPELWIWHTIKRGAHLYAVYPPAYAVFAVLPCWLFGVRGMYLLNAIAFAFAMPAFYRLASRILDGRRALLATFLLPVTVPIVPWLFTELPHPLSLALVLWTVALWDAACEDREPARARLLAAAAGLLGGMASGVRIPNFVLLAPLFGLALLDSRHRRRVLVPFAIAFGACLVAIGACNFQRFGSPNPFSYGGASGVALPVQDRPDVGQPGRPIVEETAGYFLRPEFLVLGAMVVAFLVVAPRLRRAVHAAGLAAALLVGVVLVPTLRERAARMAETVASFVVNATAFGAGWSHPHYTGLWIDKALLASTPFLVLGLIATAACTFRRVPTLPRALAWMTIALVVFLLSTRDPDPRTERSVIGFFSLSPRYLLEISVFLYLLAFWLLREVPFRRGHVRLAGLTVVALFFLFVFGGPDSSTAKRVCIVSGSVAAAGLLALAYGGFGVARWRHGRRTFEGAASVVAGLAAMTSAYGAACVFGEDMRAFYEWDLCNEESGARVASVLPPSAAIVSYGAFYTAISHLRASRRIVTVDPGIDRGASLADTLDRLRAAGFAPFYYGKYLDHVRPHFEARYTPVPILDEPTPLWRLDPAAPLEAPSRTITR